MPFFLPFWTIVQRSGETATETTTETDTEVEAFKLSVSNLNMSWFIRQSDRNRQKRIEIDRNGQKMTETDRNRQFSQVQPSFAKLWEVHLSLAKFGQSFLK